MVASVIMASASPIRIKLFKGRPCQLSGSGLRHSRHVITPPRCSMRASMAQFGEPEKLKVHLNVARERLWETVPNSVKDFPWKEAEDKILHRLVLLGHKVLKWSIVSLFVFSSLSDFVYAVAKNNELMIPLGLFIGCLMADFLKEIFLEFFSNSEDKRYDLRHLTTTGFIFLLVKIASVCFALRTRVFLLHVSNGGLMQVLWLWRNSSRGTSTEEKSSIQEDEQPSLAVDGQD
ncbi:uncharacterized protein LOC116215549 isoform X1 [Punica granatum]|uniref:Uncharacterized protein LOC116215549 isoform X1 n=2 Tax=Punica granatum TaxID=22663 RepID=A0A6P8EPR4_PUNGR|nr:uncharacterized protein LOC116215549 isoform X1 [Punica granatum]PKI46944.1 hypothetical protein CRG98_032643 [Punica granatum]